MKNKFKYTTQFHLWMGSILVLGTVLSVVFSYCERQNIDENAQARFVLQSGYE